MVSRNGALKLNEVEAYLRVCKWLGKRSVQEADTADYFTALQVQRRISNFAARNRIQVDDVQVIVHAPTGKAFLKWKGLHQ